MPEAVYPLAGINPANPTLGGFGYLDWNSYPGYAGDAFHPGIDFNAGGWGDADCGNEVYALADGIVVAVLDHTSSYGEHVWIAHPAYNNRHSHYCHLQQAFVSVGDTTAKGQVIGLCGKSAKGRAVWPYCHTHTEVMRAAPPNNQWDFWPLFSLGYTTPQSVDVLYENPLVFIAALANELPPAQESDEVIQISNEDLTNYFGSLGQPVNPDTALMQRAFLAYRRDENPGPALTGEYAATNSAGAPVVRQDFTARICEYNPATGWCGWVEVVAHPEALQHG